MTTVNDPKPYAPPGTEVEALVGLSRSTIYELMRDGEFPLPLQVGKRAVRWHEREIAAWLAERPRATGWLAEGPRATGRACKLT